MRNDPEYRHLVKKFRGPNAESVENDNSNIGNVGEGNGYPTSCEGAKNQVSNRRTVKDRVIYEQSTLSCAEKAIAHVQEQALRNENNKEATTTSNLGLQLNKSMVKLLINQMQADEIYSPPRVAEVADDMGMRGGWGLDVTTHDEDGMPWDFNDARMRNRAIRKMLQGKPLVFIGSPMCTGCNAMNRISHSRLSKEEVNQRMAYARKRMEFYVELCEIQWRSGRYFRHGHPVGASSWQESMMQKVLGREGVQRVIGDQCQCGPRSRGKSWAGPARKKDKISYDFSVLCQALE